MSSRQSAVFGFAVFGEAVFGSEFDFVGTVWAGSKPSSLTVNVGVSTINAAKQTSQLLASKSSSQVEVKVRPSELKAEARP